MGVRRRRAARRLLLVLAAGLAAQIGIWMLAGRHVAVTGAVIGGVGVVMFASAAVLIPMPAAGFCWPWQRTARERRRHNRHSSATALDAGAGLDLLFFVSILAVVLPGQVANAWAQHIELDLGPDLAFTLGVDGAGLVLLYGILEWRRRHHPDRPGVLPRTVELRRRDRSDEG